MVARDIVETEEFYISLGFKTIDKSFNSKEKRSYIMIEGHGIQLEIYSYEGKKLQDNPPAR